MERGLMVTGKRLSPISIIPFHCRLRQIVAKPAEYPKTPLARCDPAAVWGYPGLYEKKQSAPFHLEGKAGTALSPAFTAAERKTDSLVQ